MNSIRQNIREQPAQRRSTAPLLYTLMLLLSIAIAGCSSSTTDPGGTDDDNGTTNPPSANSVTMEGISFVPGDLTVSVGTTVTWTNESSVVHTVTSGSDGTHDGIFNSGDVAPDEEFSHTFTNVGSFPYYCIPHVNQGMTGTIIVEAAD